MPPREDTLLLHYSHQLKISVKWTTRYDYYLPKFEWASGEWSHVTFTWAADDGVRAFLNGCDMDANGSKGYAYTDVRNEAISSSTTFHFGAGSGKESIAGTTLDELCIWHETLSSNEIWQFYIQSGMCGL